MLSKQIVDSDAFLDMPPTAQNLYFHLVMRADDEGFVGNPKKIMRMLNIGDDDYKILVAKRFVLIFDSGVLVIKHWLMHNAIRMDRFNETAYQKEKKQITTKGNKAYTECQPNGNQLVPQVKLSKVKLSKDKKDENKFSPLGADLIKSFELINPSCKRMYGNKTQRQACDDLIENYTFERVKTVIEKTLTKTNEMEYFPTITTPLQLFQKWSSLESAIVKHQGRSKNKGGTYHG